MLVSELRKSLTELDRRVKCFSFLPSEDLLSATANSPLRDSDGSTELPTAEAASPHALTTSGQFSEYTLPRNHMDNFAVGILTAFDDSMKRIRYSEQKSHSLPDVFSASQLCNGTLSTSESVVSSTSVSMASALDCSKDDSPILLSEDPIISISTPSMNGLHGPTQLFVGDQDREPHLGSSGTVDESSQGGSELGEKSPEFSPKQHSGRVSMEGSSGEMAEAISPNVTLDRSSLQYVDLSQIHA